MLMLISLLFDIIKNAFKWDSGQMSREQGSWICTWIRFNNWGSKRV